LISEFFDDSYLLDILDLKENYLEADLKKLFLLTLKHSSWNSVEVLLLGNGKNIWLSAENQKQL